MNMCRKLGNSDPFLDRGLGPHLIQSRLGQGLPPYQVASWSMQPFGHNRHGPKIEGLRPIFGEGAGSSCNTKSPGLWGLPPYQVTSWCIQPFGHNRNGPKIGERALPPPFGMGAQCGLVQGPLPCQVPSWSIQPFGHNGHGPKIGEVAPLPFEGGKAGCPSNTKSHGPTSASIPSGILIHPAIWPQQILAENWRLCPFGEGKLGPHVTQYVQGRGLPAKFHVDRSNHLATVHQRHKQDSQTDRQTDRQERQQSDSIGRTVLQTVVQKLLRCYVLGVPSWTRQLMQSRPSSRLGY